MPRPNVVSLENVSWPKYRYIIPSWCVDKLMGMVLGIGPEEIQLSQETVSTENEIVLYIAN